MSFKNKDKFPFRKRGEERILQETRLSFA